MTGSRFDYYNQRVNAVNERGLYDPFCGSHQSKPSYSDNFGVAARGTPPTNEQVAALRRRAAEVDDGIPPTATVTDFAPNA